MKDRIDLRNIQKAKGPGGESDNTTYLPCNVDRLIFSAKRKFNCNQNKATNLHPKEVITSIAECLDRIKVVSGTCVRARACVIFRDV